MPTILTDVLVLVGIELILFLIADTMLCFGVRVKIVFTAHKHFSYCRTVTIQIKDFSAQGARRGHSQVSWPRLIHLWIYLSYRGSSLHFLMACLYPLPLQPAVRFKFNNSFLLLFFVPWCIYTQKSQNFSVIFLIYLFIFPGFGAFHIQ